MAMANVQVEIKFAQGLAGNEKKYRDKALKKLKKFLKIKSSQKKDGFTNEDFLKLWKGLHYCMWMQDKAVVQEELCSNLSTLVHELSSVDVQMLFIRVFYLTEAREWNSIDIWRLDKFMMLVRSMLNEALVVLKKNKWKSSLITDLNTIHRQTVLHPKQDNMPDGLKIHMADIYLDELQKVGHKQLDGPKLLQLLDPFINYVKKAPKSALVKRIVERVFQPIIDRALQVYLKVNRKEEALDDEDIPYLSLKFDCQLIADHIFQAAQGPDVLGRNRPVLYSIVTELRDAMNGVVKDHGTGEPEDISKQEVSHAINSLVSLESKFMATNKKKKKKDKPKGKEEKENVADGNNNMGSSSVYEPDEEFDVAPEENTPVTRQPSAKKKFKHPSVYNAQKDSNTDSPSKAKRAKHSEVKMGKETDTSGDGGVVEVVAKTVKKGNKRSHTETGIEEAPSHKVPKVVVEDTSLMKQGNKTKQETVLGLNVQKKEKSTPVSTTVFAKFDASKPPPAFLRKSFAKASVQKRPATPFATAPPVSLDKTPSNNRSPAAGSISKTPGSNKRVSFNMNKNTSQGFKESTKKPVTPYNPGKKPDQGILKTPTENTTPKLVATRSASVSSSAQKRVTRQSLSTPKSSGSHLTADNVRGKRMRAADFFL